MRYLAVISPINGQAGPFQTWMIRTKVPLRAASNVHSTSIPFVTPAMCVNRTDGRGESSGFTTLIREVHHVGQSMRPNGRLADISTIRTSSDAPLRKRTYR